MKTKLLLHAIVVALATTGSAALAAWPEKPVKTVVPFPAGGASDLTARAIGQSLSRQLGQPVLVENRPGASGGVAAQAVMSAPADGYTLLWGSASMVALPSVLRKPPYASMNEMTPVAVVGRLPFCVFVHPSVAATSVQQFKVQARQAPGKLNFAAGSLSEHLAGTQLNAASGAQMQLVPYKGGAQLMPDLAEGRVQVNIGPCSTGMVFVKSGRLRVLATVLPARSKLLPEVPTAAEAGLAELSVPTWQALLAPPRTPAAVVERLAREVDTALKDPETLAQLDRLGVQPESLGPAALAARIAQEAPQWERFARQAGIEPE
jgi:tripartite-type tricarboxylate transporter receptor subunit TctC